MCLSNLHGENKPRLSLMLTDRLAIWTSAIVERSGHLSPGGWILFHVCVPVCVCYIPVAWNDPSECVCVCVCVFAHLSLCSLCLHTCCMNWSVCVCVCVCVPVCAYYITVWLPCEAVNLSFLLRLLTTSQSCMSSVNNVYHCMQMSL